MVKINYLEFNLPCRGNVTTQIAPKTVQSKAESSMLFTTPCPHLPRLKPHSAPHFLQKSQQNATSTIAKKSGSISYKSGARNPYMPSSLTLLLALCLSTTALSQTLARPGWAGSGMSAEPWWKHAVVYQLDPHNFNNDGLKSIPPRLDYLQSL